MSCVVSIRNCSWGYKCERNWESLDKTTNNNIRFCNGCQHEVYQVSDVQSLLHCVARNRCVFFDYELLKQAGMGESGADEEPELLGWLDF